MLWAAMLGVLALLLALIYFTFGTVPTKTLAVAQAAYRETVRQPLYWFLFVLTIMFMILSAFIPYFTLGEDLKMMKELQLDAILLPTLLLTVFTAAISISEEIEGRTAITLLSKPISRRTFLLGKFIGILCGALLMAIILGLFMSWTINLRIDIDRMDRLPDPPEVEAAMDALSFLPGVITSAIHYFLQIMVSFAIMSPGLVLGFCQVMILTAVAVALATRLPMLVNVVTCVVIFLMGRLTPVLESQSKDNRLVNFVAQVFSTLLPGLNYYDVGPSIVSEISVPWVGYVLPALIHGLIYTAIALLFGLILFEDRDLA
jgi:ABC-type transport system involved in multi-copper enzyme maturation permease subunit